MTETEKLTINLTAVDLGRIELLVQQGFYSNRAEFIRVAIHAQLERDANAVREAAARHSLVIGAVSLSKRTLEEYQRAGKKMRLEVVGFASLADDISPELARAVIESVTVHGIFRASKDMKEALRDRTT